MATRRDTAHYCNATVLKKRPMTPRYWGVCGQPATIHVTDEHAPIRKGWYCKRHGKVAEVKP